MFGALVPILCVFKMRFMALLFHWHIAATLLSLNQFFFQLTPNSLKYSTYISNRIVRFGLSYLTISIFPCILAKENAATQYASAPMWISVVIFQEYYKFSKFEFRKHITNIYFAQKKIYIRADWHNTLIATRCHLTIDLFKPRIN